MAAYKIHVLTDKFTPFFPQKRKNNPFEELNAHMTALNGWEIIDDDEINVLWRIDHFFFYRSHYDNPGWVRWFHNRNNFVTFTTENGTFYRSSLYADSGKRDDIVPQLMEELRNTGEIEIPFSVTFNDPHFADCKMIVRRIND